jgi:hypothetical protein
MFTAGRPRPAQSRRDPKSRRTARRSGARPMVLTIRSPEGAVAADLAAQSVRRAIGAIREPAPRRLGTSWHADGGSLPASLDDDAITDPKAPFKGGQLVVFDWDPPAGGYVEEQIEAPTGLTPALRQPAAPKQPTVQYHRRWPAVSCP